jgi:hypothetical protein
LEGGFSRIYSKKSFGENATRWKGRGETIMERVPTASEKALTRIPGAASLALLLAALVIADVELFVCSVVLGLVYAAFVPAAFLPALALYCRKCPHAANDTCRHVFVGKIARALFGTAPPTPYSAPNIIGTLLPIAAVLLFPQYWLFQAAGFAVVFWALAAPAGALVPVGVCPGCGNVNCRLRPARQI